MIFNSITVLRQELSSFTKGPHKEPGSSKRAPLRIYSAIKLQTNRPIWITSPYPISFNNHIWISAKKPVPLILPRDILINSLEPLNKSFQIGWAKLPDELKVKIFANLVVQESAITEKTKHAHLDYLRLTPDMAALANTAFYQKNVFRVELGDVFRQRPRLPPYWSWCVHPSLNFTGFIRNIEIHMPLKPNCWYHLHRLARRQYGFFNLKRVTVSLVYEFLSNVEWELFADEVGNDEVVRFNCQGTISAVVRTASAASMSHISDHTILEFIRTRIQFLP